MSPSIESYVLLKVALEQVANTDCAPGELLQPYASLHAERITEAEAAVEGKEAVARPLKQADSLPSSSSGGCALQAKPISLPYDEHVPAPQESPSPSRVSSIEIPLQSKSLEPYTDATEASLPSFPSSFPSFKRIPGTRFIVDGFRHAGAWSLSYFLSHFHSDHYTGLSSTWNKGIIFCSQITARLVVECIKVPPPFVCALPMGEPVDVDSSRVTLVEANHCPGAVQFLFQVPTEKSDVFMRYVHTGDMRYSPEMNADPSLCDFVGADAVFLDTTYCNPKFIFPTQSESVGYIAETIFKMKGESTEAYEGLTHVYGDSEELAEEGKEAAKSKGDIEEIDLKFNAELHLLSSRKSDILAGEAQCSSSNVEAEKGSDVSAYLTETDTEDSNKQKMGATVLDEQKSGSILFLISTYVIGKEKILLAVSKRCNCPIYVNEKKLAILKCLNLENLDVFTTIPSATNVHVVSWNFLGETWPFFRPNYRKMGEMLKKSGCDRIVGFVPTGWTYETKKKTFSVRKKGPLEIHLVPYSEHSNYDELRQYVAFLRPHEIIPTVGLEGGNMESKAVAAMRKHFRNLVDETASKRRFLKGFRRKSGEEDRMQEEESLASFTIALDSPKPNLADLQQTEHLSHEATPKAAFGKSAKKRRREIGQVNESMDSVALVAKKGKASAEVKSSHVMGPIVSENKPEETTSTATCSEEKEEQLRAVLPEDVNKKQLYDLLFQANGDLDTAVTLYFEGSCCTVNERQGQASGSKGGEQFLAENEAVERIPLPAKHIPQAGKGIHTSMTGNVSKKTARSTTSRTNKRGGTASQASILTFFKKSESGTTLSTSVEKSSSCEAQLVKRMKRGEGNEHKGLVVGKNSDPHAGSDQLLTILGGAVALEKAQSLLEQTHGDVGAALDLLYGENNLSLPESNTKDFVSEKNDLQCTDNVVPVLVEANSCKNLEVTDRRSQQHPGQRHGEQVCRAVASEGKNDYVAMSIWEYKPVEYACWSCKEPAPYVHLARTFELVEQESGRLKTSDMLCNMFRSLLALCPEAVLPAVYLSTNRIAPDYENVDLNIGGSTVSAAIVEATGTQKFKIREMYNTMGDLGDVAQACRQTQSLLVAPRILSIQQVFSTLLQISKETGSGSSLRKKNLILSLLRACREKEMKYIVRTLVQNMRIGAMMRSVLPALAQAIVLHTCNNKSEQVKTELQNVSSAILEAYNCMPNLNILVPALLQDGIKTVLSSVTVSPGIPVKPMLARITNGIAEVFKRFRGKPFTCEYKYDGQRAQVHVMKDGSIKIFSRNCEDTTSRFPDVLDIVRMALRPGIQDVIFDAEIVAVDKGNNNKLMAFQHLSTRERGRSGAAVNIENIKVDVCLFVFDIMFVNGEPLVKLPFKVRRSRMVDCFMEGQAGRFGFAKQITMEANEADIEHSSALTTVEVFLEEAINSSCEGMMVKALDEESIYAPSKRSDSWLKVKRDYIEGLHDTLDLVPIGAWHGNGRKAGWFSPFLLACYDADREEFQSVCRVMSGFTDAFYKQMKAFFSDERIFQKKPTYYQTLEDPDVWFSPEFVWEIRGADLTVSPVHQAAVGLVHPSRGISLRFPRFIKERPDKKPEDATSPSEIADLFQLQSRKLDIPGQLNSSPAEEEDT